jgi:hypothetical protein
MAGQEAKIEKAVCDYARVKGCYVRKFASPNHRGVPDRLFIGPKGNVFFLEFKAPGKEPTALQHRELEEIRKRGVPASWVDSIDGGKQFIDEFTNEI